MIASILCRFAIFAVFGWFIFLAVFLIRNDFPKEALDVSYTALGGVIVPAFLLAKLIWSDPVKPLETVIPTTLIANNTSGQLHSLFRANVTDTGLTMMQSQFGVQEIETLPYFEKFKVMQLEPLHQKLLNQQPQEFNELLLEEVEFVLVQWLAHFNVPSWLNEANASYGLNSAGWSKTPKVPEGHQVSVKFDAASFPKNRFLALFPFSVELPSGSRVASNVQPMRREITIESKYSSSKLTISSPGGGGFLPTLNPLNSRIAMSLGLNPQATFSEYRLELKWKVELNRFTRFSEEGRLQSDWFDATKDALINAFSTDKLLLRFRQ